MLKAAGPTKNISSMSRVHLILPSFDGPWKKLEIANNGCINKDDIANPLSFAEVFQES